MTVEITEQELADARQIWGDALIAISEAFDKEGIDAARLAANGVLDSAYGYELGPVLFKPTLAAEVQFRGTFEEALSYFVATNKVCGEDSGFAIKGWTAVRFENTAVLLNGNTAMAMGNYFFTDPQGEMVKVEYSFGYVLDDHGKVKIVLHHSSVPYAGSSSE